MTNTQHEARRKRESASSRRIFLRGAGVTMALPWLESLAGLGVSSASAATDLRASPSASPCCSWATGSVPPTGGPKGRGAGMELSKSLAPLEPLKAKINVIDGLFNKQATGLGIHPAMTGNILSGVPLQKGAILHGGISMDQVLANRIGQETPQPSMVLGCEQPITGYHETNFSMAYSSHISWQSATRRCPWKSIPRWPSTACSTTAAACATPASWTA